MPKPRGKNPAVRAQRVGRPALIDEVQQCLGARVALEALVLFGSRARGDPLDTSDWDLAVVSPDFQGLNPLERGLRVVDCLLPGIELVYLTPSELLEPTLSYLRCAILEEGVPVVDRGAYARARAHYAAQKAAGRIRYHGAVVEFD